MGQYAVGDTDDIFFDARRRRVYVSGGDGALDVFDQRDVDHLARVTQIPTAAGARTSLFVAEQQRLYLGVPHRGSQAAEIRIYDVH